MSYSEARICNIALTQLGQSSIHALTDQSENARRCAEVFDISRDYVLSRGDWSFARKTQMLQPVDEDHPQGVPHQLPSDCLSPLRLYPRGSEPTTWEIEGDKIIIPQTFISISSTERVYLAYTAFLSGTKLFTISFVNAMAADMVARLVFAFTGEKDDSSTMRSLAELIIDDMVAEDASRGSRRLHPDQNPNNDTFVNPDAGQKVYYGPEDTSS